MRQFLKLDTFFAMLDIVASIRVRAIGESSSIFDFYIKKRHMIYIFDENIKCKPSKNSAKLSLRVASCWA